MREAASDDAQKKATLEIAHEEHLPVMGGRGMSVSMSMSESPCAARIACVGVGRRVRPPPAIRPYYPRCPYYMHVGFT